LEAFFKSISVKNKTSDLDEVKYEMKMATDLVIADESSHSDVKIITA
jgi:hypothetical protein